MPEKTDPEPGIPGAGELLVTNEESRKWEVFQAVRDLHRQGYNTQDACAKLGIERTLYYRALKSRYVQEQRLSEMLAMKEASASIIGQRWASILVNMTNIARSGHDKEAVQAARFVREVMKDLEEDAEAIAAQEQDHALADFAERLKGAPGRKTFTAKRSRKSGKEQVVEEVKVEIPDFSGGKE